MPEQGHGRNRLHTHFQVLKLFKVVVVYDISMAFRCPVLVPDSQCERCLHNIGPSTRGSSLGLEM